MKNESVINQFDACVKNCLKKELLYRIRTINNYKKHYVIMSELSKSDQDKLCTFDVYPSDAFREKLTTRLFETEIHNELLYQALLLINPITRELIILKFWGDMTDKEIGEILSMSRKMVNYYKNKALINLKEIIEELNKNEK